jgi:hypothetical protein
MACPRCIPARAPPDAPSTSLPPHPRPRPSHASRLPRRRSGKARSPRRSDLPGRTAPGLPRRSRGVAGTVTLSVLISISLIPYLHACVTSGGKTGETAKHWLFSAILAETLFPPFLWGHFPTRNFVSATLAVFRRCFVVSPIFHPGGIMCRHPPPPRALLPGCSGRLSRTRLSGSP